MDKSSIAMGKKINWTNEDDCRVALCELQSVGRFNRCVVLFIAQT